MSTVPTTPLAPEELRRRVAEELESWEAGELAAFLERRGESKEQLPDRRPQRGRPRLRPRARRRHQLGGRRPARPLPLHARAVPDDVPLAPVDDAPDRGLRHAAGDQPALPVPDRPGPDRHLGRLRHADADGLRLRRPEVVGEVGREGVAIDVLDDMEALFDGIDLEEISVSMTINPSAWILLAMYVAVAEERGLDFAKLSGTIQNDILKEYIAQKEWIYPPRESMRIVRDTITYCRRAPAPVQPDQHLGLPHLRGGGERRSRRPPSRWPSRARTCAR